MIHPENIPAELKASHRWVRGARCDVRQPDGSVRKSCKPPFNSRTGQLASHADPQTWSDYADTVTAHEANAELHPSDAVVTMHDERYIGMVIGPPWIAGDIDKCVIDGVVDPEIAAWIEDLNTYTEVSPSGTGLRFILHGEPPYPEGHRKNNVEVYSTKRWVTLTGNVLAGHEAIRRFNKEEVAALYSRVKAGKTKLNEPTGTFTGAKIADLMNRTDHADLSQAVMSLLTLLAIEEHCDRERVEARFKESKLYTETHWNEKWTRLGPDQLTRAIEYAKDNLAKRNSRGGDEVRRERNVRQGRGTVRKHARYAWDPVLPLGKLTHFGGASSQGKSPVTIDLMARVTTGREWPDGSPNTWGPRDVILFNVEDTFDDTILPRFDLAGGDDSRLFYFEGVKVTRGDVSYEAIANFQDDLLEICAEARSHKELGLIIVDPMTNHLGKAKMNAEEEVRNIINPLAALAKELQCCPITVGHLNKSDSPDPLKRMMGAAAFVGVARSVYLFSRDEDSKSPYDHVMAPVRGQMGTSYKYSTTAEEREYDGEKSKVIRVNWNGLSKQTAEEGVGPQMSQREKGKMEKAAIALKNFLKGGKKPASECIAFMKVEFPVIESQAARVRELAGADTEQKGGKWWWFLPTAQHEFEKPPARDDGAPTF